MLSTTSASAITYSLAATQTDDYAATGETLVFANDALQIQNTIIDGDIDKVSFTVANEKFLPNIILTAFTGTGSDQIDFSLNDVQYNFGATDVGNRLFTNLVGGTTYTMEFSSPVGQKESSYTLDVLQKDLVLPTFDANNDISFVSTAQNNVAGRIEFGLNAGDMLRVLTVSNLVGTISFELVGSPYSYSGAVPCKRRKHVGNQSNHAQGGYQLCINTHH
jgi:hypothetical protein